MSWTPQDISPSVWFDFSDSNMVTVESSRIVRVDDKVTSSTNYAWAPSTSLRPYTTTVNGLTAAYGAGTSVLEVGTPVLYGSNTMIFLVAKPSPANDTLKYVIAAPTSQTHGAFAILTNFVDPKPNFEF